MTDKFNFNCLKVSLIAFTLLIFHTGWAQQSFTELAEVVKEKSKTYKTDVVLLVANKDTIVYQNDTRMFSAARGQAPIGYSSQWLTAALVMAMVDEGKISLDDKVSQYIPIFGSYAKNYITIRHCLSSFTGIQAESSKAIKILDKKKYASLEEEVNEFAKRHIQNNPGEAFRFNTMGVNIAGRILEIVSKKKFDMLAQQKLFRPLEMRMTTFSTIDLSAINPSTGAKSTAMDYMRFLSMLLNNGIYKGKQILSEASVKELRNIYTQPEKISYSPETTKGYSYASGAWATSKSDNDKLASVLFAPSFGGTTPLVDFCRGYAFMFLVKELDDEQKGEPYTEVKDILDTKFKGNCN